MKTIKLNDRTFGVRLPSNALWEEAMGACGRIIWDCAAGTLTQDAYDKSLHMYCCRERNTRDGGVIPDNKRCIEVGFRPVLIPLDKEGNFDRTAFAWLGNGSIVKMGAIAIDERKVSVPTVWKFDGGRREKICFKDERHSPEKMISWVAFDGKLMAQKVLAVCISYEDLIQEGLIDANPCDDLAILRCPRVYETAPELPGPDSMGAAHTQVGAQLGGMYTFVKAPSFMSGIIDPVLYAVETEFLEQYTKEHFVGLGAFFELQVGWRQGKEPAFHRLVLDAASHNALAFEYYEPDFSLENMERCLWIPEQCAPAAVSALKEHLSWLIFKRGHIDAGFCADNMNSVDGYLPYSRENVIHEMSRFITGISVRRHDYAAAANEMMAMLGI